MVRAGWGDDRRQETAVRGVKVWSAGSGGVGGLIRMRVKPLAAPG